MHNLSRRSRIKTWLFNVFLAPFVGALYIIAFPAIYFIQSDLTKKDKLELLMWCSYSVFLYPIYALHYIIKIDDYEYKERIKEHFVSLIE